ncbi:MAG TPA: prenyltransferase/squalene oxidase repeat-containing protein [Candidatus Eisenbacteria bacterium]|nr:prenyltransferase/squalene oxidase repeat-containing protein [Candidatus Eisenbacteria bacterium]
MAGCAAAPWEPRDERWRFQPFEWLAAQQNGDGSWGEGADPVEGFDVGRTGITGFVLLSSVQHYGAPCDRDTRRRGAEWLIAQQESDGTFRGSRPGSLDAAIAACALFECRGWEHLEKAKGPARAALEAVMRERRPDGTWGEPLRTWWAFAAMDAARMNDFPYDERAWSDSIRILDEDFDRRPDFATAVAPIVRHFKGPAENRRRSLPWVVARPPDPGHPNFPAWFFGSSVVFGACLNPDPEWRRWTEALERALAELGRGDHWPGPTRDSSIVRTVLVAFCQGGYWASRRAESRNVFKGAK